MEPAQEFTPEIIELPDVKEMLQGDMTLGQILSVMEWMDDGLVELTPEEMVTLRDKCKAKVDDYKFALDDAEADEAKFKKRIEEWKKAKDRAAKKQQRIMSLMLYNLEKSNADTLPGEDYVVKIRKSEKCVVKAELDNKALIEFGDWVKTKHEWKTAEIKKALKAGDDKAKGIAEIIVNKKPHWQVKKGK